MPLRFNTAQEKLYEIIREEHEKGPVRIVVLKGRQMGCSTMIEGVFFADSATAVNADTLIMAHDDEATRHLFEMNRLFFDELPEPMKPMLAASNAQELVFENPTKDQREKKANPGLRSRIRCVTAGSKGAGRSFTFRNVHGSEVAFWPNFLRTHVAVMQAVPNERDTCVIYETTANGMNEFKAFWDDAVAGRNGFRAVFLPWYLDAEYQMPVTATDWTDAEKDLLAFGLTPEQLTWRRWCIRTNCAGDEEMFRQEYPTTPEEAFLTTGRPFFDNARLALVPGEAPKHVGWFEYTEAESGKPENIVWHEDARGYIRIWEEPEPGKPYVLGADSAGDGTDRFTAHGIDNVTGMQVCEYENPVSERLFARQLWCLGMYFNAALLALEVNYGSYAETVLEDWGYPLLYQRQRYDSIRKEFVSAYGFRTDGKTRPLAVGTIRTVMAETPEAVRSKWTLRQMLNFQYDEHGKPQGIGDHDDLVLAAAICHMARGQQRTETLEKPQAHEKLIDKWKRDGTIKKRRR